MGRLRIETLGPLIVFLDQERIAFDTDKTGALLVYLTTEANREHQREHLAALLWSDLSQERALHSLRQALSFLRKAVREEKAETPFLISTRNTIQWNPASDTWLDLRAFKLGIDCAYQHHQRRNGWGGINIRAIKTALTLFQGVFLDQLFLSGSSLFDEWAALQREELNNRALQALEMVMEYHERRGEYTLARQAAARLIALAPWEETARAHLMRLLALDGQWSAAQNQYILLRRSLTEQLGVEPSRPTIELFENIRRAAEAQAHFPPRFALTPTDLPETPTVFIGRSACLNELAERIADPECRLLTILGVGGIGKTRLALEAAREEVGIFADGVFFISLLSTGSAAQLPAFIGSALGLVFSERSDPHSQLLDFLRRKSILLLLDNFEHLLGSANSTALLSEIFHQAPGVMMLVTSRERLNLQEEFVFRLSGLDSPPAEANSPGAAENFDACSLFLRRARQATGQQMTTPADLSAIAQICSLLAGLPLGIELAAAATWDHTCREIAALIAEDMNAITASSSNAPARHRSLHSAFSVSWELLKPAERALFCQLSLFRGGFTPAAARQAAGAGSNELAVLVDKSLLSLASSGRYHMHEAIRQYAAERLAEDPARSAQAAARCAQYYLQMTAEQHPHLLSSRQLEALSLLQADLQNIHQSWLHAVNHANFSGLAACADSLYHFYNITSRFNEGIDLFLSAITGLEHCAGGERALVMSLLRAASLGYRIRKYEVVEKSLARASTLLPAMDAREEGFYLIILGGLKTRQKDYDPAMEYARQSQVLYHSVGDLWGEGYALYLQTLIYSRQNRMTETLRLVEQTLELNRRTGNERSLIAPLNLLADARCSQGDYDQAEKIFNEVLTISRRLNDRYNQAVLLNNLATVYYMRGAHQQEKQVLEESLAICQEIGDRDGETIALNNLGEMCVAQQHYDQALKYSRQALAMARETGEEWSIVVCLNNIGDALLGLGRSREAEDQLQQGLALAQRIAALDQAARVAVNLARVYVSRGLMAQAQELARAVLAHSSTEEHSREVSRAILRSAAVPLPQEANDDHELESLLQRITGE